MSPPDLWLSDQQCPSSRRKLLSAGIIQRILFPFYLLFNAAMSSRAYSQGLQLFDRQKPMTYFSLVFLSIGTS